jgi:hypothetical protein
MLVWRRCAAVGFAARRVNAVLIVSIAVLRWSGDGGVVISRRSICVAPQIRVFAFAVHK